MSTKLAQWSKDVRDRDGKCLNCGATEGLHAHHIKPKSRYPELILDFDNGKTLCYVCHKREHEANRAPRIRSAKPNRNTLIAKLERMSASQALIAKLRYELKVAKAKIAKLERKQQITADTVRSIEKEADQERKRVAAYARIGLKYPFDLKYDMVSIPSGYGKNNEGI